MNYSKITGWGFHVPENIVTNHDLAKVMDTSDSWIVERSGIRERRFYAKGEDTVTSLAKSASLKAIEQAKIDANEIDLIVFATLSPDYYFPGCGVLLQEELGLAEIPAFDIRQQCSGFIYGLSLADQYIKSGMYKTILLVGSEIHSTLTELSDRGRNVSVIFGDGAGAVVLQASDSPGILSTHLHSQGKYADELCMKNMSSTVSITPEMLEDGSMLPHMNGRMVFKHAVRRFTEAIDEALAANNMNNTDLDLLIPHQANQRITEAIRQKLNIAPEKVMSNIHKYGNTTAASIPIAFCEAIEEGKLKQGDTFCVAAFGAGFTWASAMIKF